MDNRPIGVFDSGVGGLTVVSQVVRTLPHEEIVYFGDTARLPYGSKSKEIVTKFSREIVNFLLEKDVKAIIIACNTASSNSYEALITEFDIPIIEVVSPAVTACLKTTKNNIVGVIGTEATIRSQAYQRQLQNNKTDIQVYSKSCPLFVHLAEEGWTNNSVAHMTTEIYLQELIDKEIDTLILGCTHYPLLEQCIKQITGNIKIINPAGAAATEMKKFLTAHNSLRNPQNYPPQHKFYVSDNTRKFNKLCKLVLDDIYEAKLVDLG